MKRTTIYLPDDMKAAIEREAARRGVTEAEIIRSAVEADLATAQRPKPTLPVFPEGLGDDIAGRTEELLESYGQNLWDGYEQTVRDAQEQRDS